MQAQDTVFAGSIPELYDSALVPLLFAAYADDIAQRVATLAPRQVLETAAGTGVVTRALARQLPPQATIVATDLNAPMLDRAAAIGTARPVQWRAADATKLPFDDASFDVVVCQFGVMFFPDKPAAFAESRRVLRAGGTLLFNVWDRIEENDFAATVTEALAAVFGDDAPRFLARTPHGYHDPATIMRDLAAGGFAAAPRIETVSARSHADRAEQAAIALCQGTPLRNEIEARAGATLAEATAACSAALTARFGSGPVVGRMRAHVVAVRA